MAKRGTRVRASGQPRWHTRWNSKLVAFDMATAGLTQVELARRAHVTQVTVSRILRGERNQVGVRQVRKVAEALGQPIERYVEDVVWEGAITDLQPHSS